MAHLARQRVIAGALAVAAGGGTGLLALAITGAAMTGASVIGVIGMMLLVSDVPLANCAMTAVLTATTAAPTMRPPMILPIDGPCLGAILGTGAAG